MAPSSGAICSGLHELAVCISLASTAVVFVCDGEKKGLLYIHAYFVYICIYILRPFMKLLEIRPRALLFGSSGYLQHSRFVKK